MRTGEENREPTKTVPGGKRIRVLALVYSMENGGAQQIILNHLRYFKDDPDVDYLLYVFKGPSDSKYDRAVSEEDLPVRYMNEPKSPLHVRYIRGVFNLAVARRAYAELIARLQPDIVHVHISGLLDKCLPGIMKSAVPVRLVTLHSDPGRAKGRELAMIRRAFSTGGFVPVCLTNEQAEKAKLRYGFDRWFLARNGLDIEAIRSKAVSRDEAKKKLGIPDGCPVICAVGRLDDIKNIPLLISAFALLPDDHMLILAGDGLEREALEEQVRETGLEERVRFLGQCSDVAPVYCASDVFAMTSHSEAFGLALLEAQIYGLRCVISAGVPDESIVTDRVEKMPAGADAADWARALRNPDYRGRAVCRLEDYSLDASCGRMKEIYVGKGK